MASNILDNIDLRKLGELLQQARKKCAMTQADAAKVIDTARTTIVAIEKGERRLKPKELIQLARAYGRDVSDFVRQNPVVEPFEVRFRVAYKHSDEEFGQINPSIQTLEELCHNYLMLEKIMDAPLPRNYPPEYDVTSMPIEAVAESIALSERQRLGLGDAPLPFLRDILEQSVGIRIFYLKMPAKYSEIYIYDEQFGGCMAINLDRCEEQKRWAIAHGYLHFLTHRRKPVIDFEGQYQRTPESERLAEAFPKYFLMPTSGLLRRFNDMYRTHNKFTLTNLFTLARYYGVSVEALVYRLEEMKLLSSGIWERLRNRGLKVKKTQQKFSLGEILQYANVVPTHYQLLAIEALDRGLITEGQFANFFNADRLEARRMAEALREYSSGMMEETTPNDLRQA